MSTSTYSIRELGQKAQDLASELRTTGILNNDSYLKLQNLLKSNLREQAVMEGSENPELWKVNCEELLKTLSEFSKLMEQYHLSNSSDGLKKKVEELERKVEELKKEVKELREKLEMIEGSRERKLESFGKELGELKKAIKAPMSESSEYRMVAQLAHMVERKMVDYVLTKVIGPPERLYITSLAHLQQALNREQNFTQPLNDDTKREEARQRWEELQARVGWQEQHYRCIEFLKAHCNYVADPELDTGLLKRLLNESNSFPHRSECEELLSMLEKINQ